MLARALASLAWDRYRTVIVYGPVPRAVWWPMEHEGVHGGGLIAPGPREAREVLLKLKEVPHVQAS